MTISHASERGVILATAVEVAGDYGLDLIEGELRTLDGLVFPPDTLVTIVHARLAAFDESQHPRDSHGRFGEGDGAALTVKGFEPHERELPEVAEHWGYWENAIGGRWAADNILGASHKGADVVDDYGVSRSVLDAIDGRGIYHTDESTDSLIEAKAQMAYDDAYTLLGGVRDASPVDYTMYRGMTVDNDAPEIGDLRGLKVGDQFDISLASFSGNPDTAQSFASSGISPSEPHASTMVTMQLAAGAKAVPVAGTEEEVATTPSHWVQVANDNIVSGRFEVTNVGASKAEVLLGIKQVGVFDPDNPKAVAAAVTTVYRYKRPRWARVFDPVITNKRAPRRAAFDESQHQRDAHGRFGEGDDEPVDRAGGHVPGEKQDGTAVKFPKGTTLYRSVNADLRGALVPSCMGESGPGVYLTTNRDFAEHMTANMPGRELYEVTTERPLRLLDRTAPGGDDEYRALQVSSSAINKDGALAKAITDAGYDGVRFAGVNKGDAEVTVLDASVLTGTPVQPRTAAFDESQHPRDDRGRFGEGDGGHADKADTKFTTAADVGFDKWAAQFPKGTVFRAGNPSRLEAMRRGEDLGTPDPAGTRGETYGQERIGGIWVSTTAKAEYLDPSEVMAAFDPRGSKVVNEGAPGDILLDHVPAERLLGTWTPGPAGARGYDVTPPQARGRGIIRGVEPRGVAITAAFDEDLHPRGQPNNAGQFAQSDNSGDKSGNPKDEPAPPTVPRDANGKLDVDALLAANPRKPDEDVFVYQGRIAHMLDDSQEQSDLLFAVRERYEPVQSVVDGMQQWQADHGLDPINPDIVEEHADLAEGDAAGRAFENAVDSPNDPEVKAAYDDFKRQNAEMYEFMTRPVDQGGMGIDVEFTTKVDPYQSAAAQAADLRDNNRIVIQSGLGGNHTASMSTAEYDQFRAVHDTFGHAAIGGGFDRHGEYEAWLTHTQMYTDPGRLAMSTEYHGVNSAMWSGDPSNPGGTGKTVLLGEYAIPPSERVASVWDEGLHPRDKGKFASKQGDAPERKRGNQFTKYGPQSTRNGPPAMSRDEAVAAGYTDGPYYHATDHAAEVQAQGFHQEGGSTWDVQDPGTMEEYLRFGHNQPVFVGTSVQDVERYGTQIVTVMAKPGSVKSADRMTLGGGMFIPNARDVAPLTEPVKKGNVGPNYYPRTAAVWVTPPEIAQLIERVGFDSNFANHFKPCRWHYDELPMQAAAFDESLHPRDSHGQFTSGDGGSDIAPLVLARQRQPENTKPGSKPARNAETLTLDNLTPAQQKSVMAKVTGPIPPEKPEGGWPKDASGEKIVPQPPEGEAWGIDATPEEVRANYEAMFARGMADPENREAGLHWYENTRDQAIELGDKYGYDLESSATAIAAMSAGTRWETEFPILETMMRMDGTDLHVDADRLEAINIKLTGLDADGNRVLNAEGKPMKGLGEDPVSNGMNLSDMSTAQAIQVMFNEHMQRDASGNAIADPTRIYDTSGGWGARYSFNQYERALEAIREELPPEEMKGVKVREFYNNITNPMVDDHVTIDVMMMQIAANDTRVQNETRITGAPSIDGAALGPSPFLADEVRRIAEANGVLAQQAQAVMWVQWLDEQKAAGRGGARGGA